MGQWSGDDWQAYCDELLIARYGTDYQRIPDQLGDYGAEGVTSDGCAVQAYAAEEVVDSKKLYEAQRDKVTRDLGKLRKNRAAIAAMIGRPIKRMILMVPEFRTKALLEHCATKAAEIREAGLEEFDEAFDIRVLTGDDFPEERRRLGEHVGIGMGLAPAEVSAADVVAWSQSNSELAANLDRKLTAVPDLSEAEKDELGEALIRLYLRREDILRQLRAHFPALWEKIHAEARGREQALAAENLLSGAAARDRLAYLTIELEARLLAAVPDVRPNGPELGWGTVAEWLLRCPLELGAPTGASA